jgi:hypothetical protein
MPLSTTTTPTKKTPTQNNKKKQKGTDQTLFAKSVGVVRFRTFIERHPSQPERPPKERRVVHVLPLGGDWSPGYGAKVAAMVAERNRLRAQRLGMRILRAR